MTGNSTLNLPPDKVAVNVLHHAKPQYLSASYKQFVVFITNTYALFLAVCAFFLSAIGSASNNVAWKT